ncbi:hypothetical protein KIN20_009616 [Parelaphostrongylus tenuis]|uniref:Uncharacterized protein n=1 Tax=Parelaphostrongylus tenuis TaxID=148309 RepID=A0AAD5QIC8_PARTN|nr:hypothetical protein KIN20_009616 [Parelaphostrongylus tenuis]
MKDRNEKLNDIECFVIHEYYSAYLLHCSITSSIFTEIILGIISHVQAIGDDTLSAGGSQQHVAILNSCEKCQVRQHYMLLDATNIVAHNVRIASNINELQRAQIADTPYLM